MDKTTRFQRMLMSLGVMAMIMATQGCSTVQRYIRPGQFSYPQLSETYRKTTLGRTGSLEVIRAAQAAPIITDDQEVVDLRDYQLVAESGQVVSVFGQSPDTYTRWFSLFGFDPYDLTARRKYFFLFNEKATASPFDEGKRFFKPKQVLVFEAELVMAEALARPARREAERRIAILREATSVLRQDVNTMTVSAEGAIRHYHELASNGMFANQILEAAARRLEQFPVMAAKLNAPEGVGFEPMGLDRGTLWMGIDQENKTVHLTIEVGL